MHFPFPPQPNFCHFSVFPLPVEIVSLCYSSLTSTLKSKISILMLEQVDSQFQIFSFSLICTFPVLLLSHSPTNLRTTKKKTQLIQLQVLHLPIRQLKTKYHSQTEGYFIITNLLIPIIPRGIEHVLLFH